MKKITAIICTLSKTMEEFQKKPIYPSLEKLNKIYNSNQFDFEIVKDNKRGLSEVYNSFINNNSYQNDILLFVHDDVELMDPFIFEKLNDSPYVVTGLAGAKSCDLNKDHLAWHLCSKREDFVGEVMHCSNNNYWTTVFGPTKQRTLIIDGLFIAINVEKIKNTPVRFNELFKFHHYDMSFCLECNKNKISVGVLPVHVIHHGLGDSMLTQEWKDSNELFKKNYRI